MMPDRSGDEVTVVVVADEESSEEYASPLRDRWSVEVATDGVAALSALDDEPGVLVLDRAVSGIHADRLLGIVRERELDTRVVMLTSVEPGTDPLRLGFDDHVVKPVDDGTLVDAVERAFRRAAYEREVSRLYELASRKASMELDRTDAELAEDEAYQQLREELSAARADVAEAFERLEDEDFGRLCDELSRSGDTLDDALPEL